MFSTNNVSGNTIFGTLTASWLTIRCRKSHWKKKTKKASHLISSHRIASPPWYVPQKHNEGLSVEFELTRENRHDQKRKSIGLAMIGVAGDQKDGGDDNNAAQER